MCVCVCVFVSFRRLPVVQFRCTLIAFIVDIIVVCVFFRLIIACFCLSVAREYLHLFVSSKNV